MSLQAITHGQQSLVARMERLEGAGRGRPMDPPQSPPGLGGSQPRPPSLAQFSAPSLGNPPPSHSAFWNSEPMHVAPGALRSMAGPAPLAPAPLAPPSEAPPSDTEVAALQARAHQAASTRTPRAAPPRPAPFLGAPGLGAPAPPQPAYPPGSLAADTTGPLLQLTQALEAHAKVLMQATPAPAASDASAIDLLLNPASTGDTLSSLDKLPGARGAASMEILRRAMMANMKGVTQRIRANRNLSLRGLGNLGSHPCTTRDYLTKEVALGHNKTGTYLAFGLADVFDLLEAGQTEQAEMTVGLLLCAVEQSALESWHWQTGWLLTHLPEPPFHAVNRQPEPAAVRPFSKLAESSWVASALQMAKDAATIQEARRPAPKRKGAGKGQEAEAANS